MNSAAVSTSATTKGAPSVDVCLAVSGETLVVPIVGDPIAQVKSPSRLSALFAERGENIIVIPAHVAAIDFSGYLAGIDVTQNILGVIATVPHKQAMMHHCSSLSERARFAGSVNVMIRKNGEWHGDNTDGLGHCNGLRMKGGVIENARVLLIGAGGAGAAIAFQYLEFGAAYLAIHDVDAKRRDGVIARLSEKFGDRVGVGTEDPTGFDIVSNATPLGMRDADPAPFLIERLTPAHIVADVVTKPATPEIIAFADRLGCLTLSGTEMFHAQEQLLVQALLGKSINEPI